LPTAGTATTPARKERSMRNVNTRPGTARLPHQPAGYLARRGLGGPSAGRAPVPGHRGGQRGQGSGPAVLCLHFVMGTSFLYRNVLAELAARGAPAARRCAHSAQPARLTSAEPRSDPGRQPCLRGRQADIWRHHQAAMRRLRPDSPTQRTVATHLRDSGK
jgi:hypothetical protein